MQNKINKKKAELTSSQFIGIVIVLIGFAILLFLFYQLAISQRADRDACHTSVITRASMPSLVKDYVPLKCKTYNYCITPSSSGSCSELGGLKVGRVVVRDEIDIGKFLAGQILECWQTMGEGKVSLWNKFTPTRYGFGGSDIYPTCIICSRIAFDKEGFKGKEEMLKKVNVQDYMLKYAPAGMNKSYMSYLSQGYANSYIDIQGDRRMQSSVIEPDKISYEDGKLVYNTGDTDVKLTATLADKKVELKAVAPDATGTGQLAILFMQITAPATQSDALKNIANDAGLGWMIGFATSPQTAVSSTMSIIKTAAKHPYITLAVLAGAGVYQYASISAGRAISAGYCGNVAVGEEAREGCSITSLVNYNVDGIKEYCQAIESVA
jgi:hypothetical protein